MKMNFERLCYILFNLLVLLCCINGAIDSTDTFQKSDICNGNYIMIATIDGMLTALDVNTGKVCWSTLIDNDKFVSSSLSNLEVYDKGYRVFLVPSLDGALFKYDVINKIIQPLPIDVESLISHSTYLDSSTNIFGGKMKIIFGIHRLTGEVVYTCRTNACETFKDADDIVIVEEIVNNINAIDSRKGEKKWHYRVVELKIKIAGQHYDSTNENFNEDKALMTRSFHTFSDLSEYKVSLHNGFAAKMNGSNENYSWLYLASTAIIDAYYVKDNYVKLLDPFGKDSGFFSTETDDKKQSALLFLGMYKNQMFIKKSRIFKFNKKNFEVKDVATNILQEKSSPVCPQPQGIVSIQKLKPKVTDLLPNDMDFNVSDHGFYFYLNYSIAENETHCIINNSHIHYDSSYHLNNWLSTYLIFFCSACLMFYLMLKKTQKKKFVNAETSPQEVNKGIDDALIRNNEISQFTEFTSRFHQDFELMCVLGKGGFGVVMDVKNRIDDCRYAVKRICLQEQLNTSQYEKVLREVKALAKLDHHGIVRYFNAWIEYPPIGWQENKDMEANISDVTSYSSESYSKESSPRQKLRKASEHAVKPKSSEHAMKPNSSELLKYLDKNPFKLSEPFTEDFSNNSESKLSDYSNSSTDSSSSSEQSETNVEIEKSKRRVENSQDSDLDILFTNEENSCNAEQICNQSLEDSDEDDNDTVYGNSDEDYAAQENSSKCDTNRDSNSSSPEPAPDVKCDINQVSGSFSCKRKNISVIKAKEPSKALSHKGKEKSSSMTNTNGKSLPIALRSRKESEVAKGYLYIQMQLCQRESLRDWLNRHSEYREYDKVMEIFAEIVDAVHYVHNCGLMHRDLKPSNIYFSLEGAIKIGDFGLATSSDNEKEISANSQQLSDIHTSDVGTEFYMSPEQKLDRDYDSKTDIYSLGIILFELLMPFRTYVERCNMLMRLRRLNFPEEFKRKYQNESELVRHLLCINPKERPTTNEIKQHPLILKYTSLNK